MRALLVAVLLAAGLSELLAVGNGLRVATWSSVRSAGVHRSVVRLTTMAAGMRVEVPG